jgi:hypothetical protein
MEFGFSDKELAFREEIEAFLKKELPPDCRNDPDIGREDTAP